MKKIFKIYLPLSALGFIVYLFIQPNPYFRRALIYNTADITDYKIFSNRVIEANNPKEWGVSENYNLYSLSSNDLGLLKKYETIAFLVVKDSCLVFENYWDGYSKDSLVNSFSMAKSIVSLLIGIAVDEGRIGSVNDPVSKYLPEFGVGDKSKIKIKDLLTMSSGLAWNESYINPFSVTTKAYYGNNLNELVLNTKVKEEPAIRFEYITPNPQLLSIIIKKVTGKSLSQYASEKLWTPLGAERLAIWSLDKEEGSEKAYCCFNSNARDFARLGQLILNNGEWNGRQIISQSYLQESLLPADYLIDEKGENIDYYGYQWWICNYKNEEIFYARGILGQYIIVIPSKDIVIVRLGNKRDKHKINHHPVDFYEYIELVLKITNNPMEAEKSVK